MNKLTNGNGKHFINGKEVVVEYVDSAKFADDFGSYSWKNEPATIICDDGKIRNTGTVVDREFCANGSYTFRTSDGSIYKTREVLEVKTIVFDPTERGRFLLSGNPIVEGRGVYGWIVKSIGGHIKAIRGEDNKIYRVCKSCL